VVAWLVPLEVNADHESSGTHKDALKSSAVRGSMDSMERGVTVAPQLSRQGAVKQPILIEGAYNGSCLHDTSTLKEGWAALTAIESESFDRLLTGTLEKAHEEVTQSKVSARKESRPFPHTDFTEPPSRQSYTRLMDRNRTPSAMDRIWMILIHAHHGGNIICTWMLNAHYSYMRISLYIYDMEY
jgi:hypothetical protein